MKVKGHEIPEAIVRRVEDFVRMRASTGPFTFWEVKQFALCDLRPHFKDQGMGGLAVVAKFGKVAERFTDRILQKLKKAGEIRSRGGLWMAVV